jgi:hypothetical protein
LEQERTRRAQSTKELEDTKENFKTQQLINMEMKDYERAVTELKHQIEIASSDAETAKKGLIQFRGFLIYDQNSHQANFQSLNKRFEQKT